jgi:hypothetical protein
MPHINFAPINTKFRNATGCKMSVDYLSKENEGKELSNQEHFFNDKQDFIGKESAKKTIDSPTKEGMSPKDARYFEVIVSFDKNELKGKTDDQLKEYVKEKFPQVYAESVKGKEVDKDKLLWVAKLEKERKYKGTDKDVIEGKAKSGQKKEGDQRHVHILIARKTSDEKMKVSPLTNHKKESKDGKVSGFDRTEFINKTEQEFDKKFEYKRPLTESFEYRNTMDKGSNKAKAELLDKVKLSQGQEIKNAPGQEIKNNQEQNKNRGLTL